MQQETDRASYLELYESGDLRKREWEAKLNLQNCMLCPRKCGTDRESGIRGYCRSGVLPRISAYGAHFGDLDPISGKKGSGTIIFSECTMGCIFCRNYPVSQLGKGGLCTEDALADIMLHLQDEGCHNISLVSPTHFVPQIIGSLRNAAARGLLLPIVYNSSGYERPEILRLLDGIVDIYVPAAKFGDDRTARFVSDAPDYTTYMKESLREMHRQTGDLVCGKDGIAEKGLLVRHLVLPGGLSQSEKVFGFISEISKDTYLNIMGDYRPEWKAGSSNIPGIERKITPGEYDLALETARALGLYRGF